MHEISAVRVGIMAATRRQRSQKKCPAGTILRNSYTRTRKASCIPDVGNPGKGFQGPGKGIGPLRKGDLSQFGYDHVTRTSEGRRHLALAKAVHEYGALSVLRKLNAVYVYTRNTAPASSAIFKADRNWIYTHYGISAV